MTNEETVDFSCRQEICNLTHRLMGYVDTVRALLESQADLDDNCITEIFDNVYNDLEEIHRISYGDYNHNLLYAAPKAAVLMFEAFTSHQVDLIRNQFNSQPEPHNHQPDESDADHLDVEF